MKRNQSLSDRTTTTHTYIGHVIGASFGLVFVLVNSTPLVPALRLVVSSLAIAMFAIVVAGFVTTLRTTGPDERVVGFTTSYWIIVGIEAVLLFGGLAVVRAIEPFATLGWIALVVGIHFFPLSRLWAPGRAQIMAIAIALTVLGAIGLVIAFATHEADAVALVSGVGSGVVLLGWSFVVGSSTLVQRLAAR